MDSKTLLFYSLNGGSGKTTFAYHTILSLLKNNCSYVVISNDRFHVLKNLLLNDKIEFQYKTFIDPKEIKEIQRKNISDFYIVDIENKTSATIIDFVDKVIIPLRNNKLEPDYTFIIKSQPEGKIKLVVNDFNFDRINDFGEILSIY